MKKFGWSAWRSLYKKYLKNNWNSLERWGLSYFHRHSSLDVLAIAIAKQFEKDQKKVVVSVDSIWIDGTPQAKAETPSGQVKCELADILLIVNERDVNTTASKQRALLIQAKVSSKYNKLLSGGSTKKERQLLEEANRSKPIEIYCDTGATSMIGAYTIVGEKYGLKDCARYMLMPKGPAWLKIGLWFAPFQIGWPMTRKSSFLRSPTSLVQAIKQMALNGKIGKDLSDPKTCEWTRLVYDLLRKYKNTLMQGYGGQPRVSSSCAVASFHPRNGFQITRNRAFSLPPRAPFTIKDGESDELPAISVLWVNIQHEMGETKQ